MSRTIVSSLKSRFLFTITALQLLLFDCLAALDGSATDNRSFMSHFPHNKVGKTKWRIGGVGGGCCCLLEVISHNHAVAVAIGGISLPSRLITVCL